MMIEIKGVEMNEIKFRAWNKKEKRMFEVLGIS